MAMNGKKVVHEHPSGVRKMLKAKASYAEAVAAHPELALTALDIVDMAATRGLTLNKGPVNGSGLIPVWAGPLPLPSGENVAYIRATDVSTLEYFSMALAKLV